MDMIVILQPMTNIQIDSNTTHIYTCDANRPTLSNVVSYISQQGVFVNSSWSNINKYSLLGYSYWKCS